MAADLSLKPSEPAVAPIAGMAPEQCRSKGETLVVWEVTDIAQEWRARNASPHCRRMQWKTQCPELCVRNLDEHDAPLQQWK
jgi:hypothetical protein